MDDYLNNNIKQSSTLQGIYMITNTITDEVYIGYSTDIKRRWSCHKANMKANRFLYKSFSNIYVKDESKIRWDILEECSREELSKRETYWIDYIRNVGVMVVNKNASGAVPLNSVEGKLHKSIAQTGERNGNAKLKEKDVLKMIRLYHDGETIKDLSKMFGVSDMQVRKICVYKETWKNVWNMMEAC